MKKLVNKISVSLILSMLFSSSFSLAQNYYPNKTNSTMKMIESNIRSERIPAGTKLKLRIEKPLNSLNSSRGESFVATVIDDVYVRNSVILPSGTTIRGRIDKIKKSTYLSRGGKLGLNFDLVETTIGRQLPLSAQISKSQYALLPNGSLSAGGGYLKALQSNLNNGVDLLTNVSGYCINKGLSFWNGFPVIITAPVGVAGGTVVGGYVFFEKSISALYHKGENVRLNPGDIVEIKLNQSLDVSIN